MRRLILPVLAAVAVFAVLPAHAADTPQRLLTVTGSGEAKAEPDQATLTAGVVSDARTAADALAANARAMNAVFDRLKAAGVTARDIQTNGLSVSPQYTQASTNAPSRVTGYRAENNVTVRLSDLSRVGATIDALVASGANSLGDITFGFKDQAALMAQARKDAIADAIARAHLMADAAGVTLGPIMSISDGEGGGNVPIRVMAFTTADSRRPTPIAAGEEGVSATVTISWEIR